MATAVQATPQSLSEDSVHSGAAAPMTTQSSSGSCPPKGEDENNTASRASQTPNAKHAKRHGNQPILVWLQRKIGGKGHSIKKRPTNDLPRPNTTLSPGVAESSDSATLGHSPKGTVRASRKHPNASPGFDASPQSVHAPSAKSDSLRPESAWGLTVEPEADDDASIRPLPPTSPPSPVPSKSTRNSDRTSGGYASDLRSARSAGAPSTKPTTLMSVELGAGGHIAQAPSISSSILPQRSPQFASPPTPSGGSPRSTRFPHLRNPASMAASVTFSPVPSGASRSESTSVVPGPVNLSAEDTQTPTTTLVVPPPAAKLAMQAPSHSKLHPRNNPRPASPPPDNASTLTLASSTFAMSLASPHPRSVAADRERDLDAAASMRALRPSSRRGSWGSDETGWSVAGISAHTGISAAGPMLLGLGAGGTSGVSGVYRRRGPGSIATARSAWSYRAGGKEGNLEGTDTLAIDDCDDCDDNGSVDGDQATRVTADDITPTEDIVFEFAAASPTSMTHPSAVQPSEVPLPASPDLTPTEIA